MPATDSSFGHIMECNMEKGGHGMHMGGALIFPVLVERHNILYFVFCIL